MGTYNIHAGHGLAGGLGCGAVGILDESNEARKVKDYAIKYLKQLGHTVRDCTYNGNASQNTILRSIVELCNLCNVTYDISIHLNSGRNDYSGDGKTGGVEVYGYNLATSSVGSAICEKISSSLGITNRGFKTNSGLYVLRNTKSTAILVECCFVDDKDDATKWDAEKCARAIVEAITGQVVGSVSQEQNPVVSVPVSNKYSVGQKVSFGTSYPTSNSPCGIQYATSGSGNGTITAIVSGQAKYCIDGNRYCNDGDIIGLYVPPVKPDIIYAVYSKKWLAPVKNDTDYAGIQGSPITAVMIKLSDGTPLMYRVHLKNGNYLPWVTGYNGADHNDGYAGDGVTEIDAIEIKCDKYTIMYKVSTTSNGNSYYPEVSDDVNDYAGVYRKSIDGLICRII